MMKTCSKCGTNKPFSEFTPDKRNKNGLASHCKCCRSVAKTEDYKSNPEKFKEKYRKYYKKYAESVKERNRKRSKNNPGLVASKRAYRRSAILQRTPVGRNRHAITLIYKEACRLSKVTGIAHDVDHIIPLQGEFVSGLHVENNLQILTAAENRSKAATFVIT